MTGFNLFSGDPQAIWDFMLMNPKTGRILSRHEVLAFVELPKFQAMQESLLKKVKTGEALTEEDRLGVWGGYFADTDMGVEIVQTMATKDPIFQELQRTEEEYWQRPEARYFRLRERLAEMDKMAEIDDAKAEARVEGRAEGILIGEARGEARGETKGEYNKAIAIAKKMLRNGTAPEIVAETVELSLEEVRSLN